MSMPAAVERVLVKLNGGGRRPGEPPLVPARLPFLGHALDFGRDAAALLRACQKTHGDVFTLLIAGKRMTFVLDPHAYVDVVKAGEELSFDAIAADFSRHAFGFSPGADSRLDPAAIREISHEILKGSGLAPLNARTHERVQAHLGAVGGPQWQEDKLYTFVHRHLFAINMETLFGVGAPAPDSEAEFRVLDDAFPMLVAGVPARFLRGVQAARERLAATLDIDRPDASAYVRDRDEYFKTRISRDQRNNGQLAALWAAEANTIPATFWTLYYLLRDPTARAAVQAELQANSGDLASPAVLKRLRLLNSSVLEALRLCSSSMVVRQVMRSFTLELSTGERHALREGDRVCLYPEVSHSDPEIFAEPERYRFDRFAGADGPPQFFKRGKRATLALMPFGSGVSMCPGRFLASNEIVQVVANVLQRLDIELLPHETPVVDRRRAGLGVLPPRSDPPFRYKTRA
jgi:cytochrome P450